MINIVFEHKDWLIVDKPEGLNFHSEDNEASLIVLLEKQLGCKLWPVHRLDKLTSGLLIVAKSKQACAQLCELFASRLVEKYYLAVVSASLKKKQGLIKGDMEKSRRGAFKLVKTQNNPAITQFFSASIKPGLRLCLLKPKTGKTHQLRVALKSQGSAILGDVLYSGEAAKRMYLHSYALSFTYQNEIFEIVSDSVFEPDFELNAVIEEQKWSQPWLIKWPLIK